MWNPPVFPKFLQDTQIQRNFIVVVVLIMRDSFTSLLFILKIMPT